MVTLKGACSIFDPVEPKFIEWVNNAEGRRSLAIQVRAPFFAAHTAVLWRARIMELVCFPPEEPGFVAPPGAWPRVASECLWLTQVNIYRVI